jgi:hypothetical protein
MGIQNIFVSSGVAAVISVLTTVTITPIFESSSAPQTNSSRSFSKEGEPKFDSRKLETEISRLKAKVVQAEKATSAIKQANADLKFRLGELEASYSLSEAGQRVLEEDSPFGLNENDLRTLTAGTSQRGSRPNIQGEAIFSSDYGEGSEFVSSSITSAFEQSEEAVFLKDVECRSTVCKVTYDELTADSGNGFGSSSVQDSIINNVGKSFEGEDLDIRHGTDDRGNEVMYIQFM